MKQSEQTAARIGYGAVHPIRSGGWSDSALIASLGVPVVCAMGVCGEFNHTAREYALVDTLYSRARLVTASVLALP